MNDSLNIETYFDLSLFEHKALFIGLKRPWEALLRIEEYLASKKYEIQVEIPSGVVLVNPESIFIGKGTLIEPGAYIAGPCYIGEACQIRQGAYIRGGLIAGKKCVIGHTTEVKNSIFFDGAQAAHFAYVGDSILGNQVNLGAGVKLANLKFDHKNVIVNGFDTGLRKFGAIVGDGVQIGCNAVTNPGTLIGKETYCAATLNFGGVIPPFSLIKSAYKPIVAQRN